MSNRIKQLSSHFQQLSPQQPSNLLIPSSSLSDLVQSSNILKDHVKWMLEKLKLDQDFYLLGPPGPLRLSLLLYLASILNREIEYVPLSHETSESDLTLKREIRNGSLCHVDQSVVRACLNGRILVLDGVENAERNVLPILNNLLENREITLEDGRRIISTSKFKEMLQTVPSVRQLNDSGLFEAHPKFLVVAIGVPVPTYRGYPLDPPFRSRFQCRSIDLVNVQDLFRYFIGTNLDTSSELATSILQFMETCTNLRKDASIAEFNRNYPFIKKFISACKNASPEWYPLLIDNGLYRAVSCFYPYINFRQKEKDLFLAFFKQSTTLHSHDFSLLERIRDILKLGPICLLGPQGSGKSTMVKNYVSNTGKKLLLMNLHKEISPKDFWQIRMTDSDGDTIWRNTPMTLAIINGDVVVLDGIDTVNSTVLSTLQRFIYQNEFELPDGRILLTKSKYDTLPYSNRDKAVPINPEFQMIAIGCVDKTDTEMSKWLSEDICNMFYFEHVSLVSIDDYFSILKSYGKNCPDGVLNSLIELKSMIANNSDASILKLSRMLSLRQMIRIVMNITSRENYNIHDMFKTIFLMDFLPSLVKIAIKELIGQKFPFPAISVPSVKFEFIETENYVRFNDFQYAKRIPTEDETLLIPNIIFYENESQMIIAREMLYDLVNGEHTLLIGNQGVGKNKIADKFLQMLRIPRLYIQLHRDTAISSITQTISIQDGKILFVDSPLAVAAKRGYYIVIDEADKAPTYVTSVIKSLVADKYLILPDGTTLTNHPKYPEDILIHPNFRVIILANRPGYPFLGNDFYREIADCFSVHIVSVPDRSSEFELLKKHAKGTVTDETIFLLQKIFDQLRLKVDNGQIVYPYSTRELVNVIKHLGAFPKSGIIEALRNVFDFDSFDPDVLDTIKTVMKEVGLEYYEKEVSLDFSKAHPIEFVSCDDTMELSPRKHIPIITEKKLHLMVSWKDKTSKRRIPIKNFGTSNAKMNELRGNFHFETGGTIVDISHTVSGKFAVVTQGPSNLYIVEKNLSYAVEIDMMDFGTISNSSSILPGSKLVAGIHGKNIQDGVALFNAFDMKLTVIDLERRVITSFKISSLKAGNTQMITYPNMAKLAFLEPNSGKLSILDFETEKEIQISFDTFNIFSIKFCRENMWLIESTDKLWFSALIHDGEIIARQIFSDLTLDLKYLCFNESTGIISSSSHNQVLIAKTPIEQLFFNALYFKSFKFDSTAETLWKWIHSWHLCAVQKQNDICILHVWDLSKNSHREIILEFDETVTNLFTTQDDSLLLFSSNGGIRVYEVISDLTLQRLKTYGQSGDTSDLNQLLNSLVGATGGSIGSGSDGEGGQAENPLQFHGPREEKELSTEQRNIRASAPVFDEISRKVSQEVRDQFLKAKLREIETSEEAYDIFQRHKEKVKSHVGQIRTLLASLEAKKNERTWLKNQSFGEIDEKRLIDGLTGEKNVYRRRGEKPPEIGGFHVLPKRVLFLFDVSASMVRYNPHDGRLDRTFEVALMIMESFKSFAYKFQYKICGHSGDSPFIEFLDSSTFKGTEREEHELLEKMKAHATHCSTGDKSIQALKTGIKEIVKAEADEYFVILLSDANISQYGIKADDLKHEMNADNRVNSFVIFLGNLEDQIQK